MIRAALLRPLNLVVPVIGVGMFATTLMWWLPPLTVVTYAALIFLSLRDTTFRERVLLGGNSNGAHRPSLGSPGPEGTDISPERRVRWLARGETRERVEAALAVYRKVVTAIGESDDVTRAVLDDTVPKLHAMAEHMVDVAHRREKAAEALEDLRSRTIAPAPDQDDDLGRLEEELRTADAEISGMLDGLLSLRARVVRISIESESAARTAAGDLNKTIDEMNLRLEALETTLSSPDEY